MDATDKKFHINFWYCIAAVLGMLLIQDLYLESRKLTPIPYSRFQTLLNEDKIAKSRDRARTTSAVPSRRRNQTESRISSPRGSTRARRKPDKHGVIYSGVIESHWLRDLLSWILPAMFFVGIWMFVIRRMGQGGLGGLMQIGKSRAKIYVEKDTKTTFADVAGVDEAKDELVEIVDFLKDPVAVRPARRARRPRACCWSARRAPARRCWRAPSPARPACRSSRSPARNSSRCSSASAPRACATCSSRRASRRRHHLHRRARRARPRPRRLPSAAGTTRRSRR